MSALTGGELGAEGNTQTEGRTCVGDDDSAILCTAGNTGPRSQRNHRQSPDRHAWGGRGGALSFDRQCCFCVLKDKMLTSVYSFWAEGMLVLLLFQSTFKSRKYDLALWNLESEQ